MKTFCILEQGKTINHPFTLRKKEVFTSDDSDFYRLNWKTDDDPNAFIKIQDILWSEGRSLLYEKVPKKYKYYIFIDEDITFESKDPVFQIAKLLNTYKPFSATFHDETSWSYRIMQRHTKLLPEYFRKLILEREAFVILFFDMCAQVFSSDFADIMFPIPYHGCFGSMLYAQWICSKLYPGKQICFGGVKMKNNWADPHDNNLDGFENKTKIINTFNSDTVDGSFTPELWSPNNLGRSNLKHSILHRVDKTEITIQLSDVKKVYNIEAEGFKNRAATMK